MPGDAGAMGLLPCSTRARPGAVQAFASKPLGLHAWRPTKVRSTFPATKASAIATLVEAGAGCVGPVEAPYAVAPRLVRSKGRRTCPST